MTNNTRRFETLCLHAGQDVDPQTLSRGVSVHRTSSYLFKDTEHAANLFALKELGNIYTRLMNPTTATLESRVAELEGGKAAVALSSGTSAVFYSIINICQAGDEFVTASNLYGGTYTQFANVLPRFGITPRFVDISDMEAVKEAIGPKTKLVFCETIGNPACALTDVPALADVAHSAGIPLVIDSTFTTPYLFRPIEHGADVVVHSLTKWLGGHGTGIGGVVVDSGKFDWNTEKFPLYSQPDGGYHGLRFGADLPEGLQEVAYALRLRLIPLRNLGACISPDNAWMFLQGIETLPLRMDRHVENARRVAQFLSEHQLVDWVRYPGLEGDPSFELAQKLLERGAGSVLVFGAKGGRDSGEKFINNLKLFSHLANVGDAKSLALHPASTSHSQLSEEEQLAGGIKPELIRLSVGLEHIDDLLEDLEQALQAAHV